jgi:hypothetical protein
MDLLRLNNRLSYRRDPHPACKRCNRIRFLYHEVHNILTFKQYRSDHVSRILVRAFAGRNFAIPLASEDGFTIIGSCRKMAKCPWYIILKVRPMLGSILGDRVQTAQPVFQKSVGSSKFKAPSAILMRLQDQSLRAERGHFDYIRKLLHFHQMESSEDLSNIEN